MSNELLTASAAARFLGVHRHTIRNWTRAGQLRTAATADGVTLFERSELERRRAEIENNPVRAGRPKRETK